MSASGASSSKKKKSKKGKKPTKAIYNSFLTPPNDLVGPSQRGYFFYLKDEVRAKFGEKPFSQLLNPSIGYKIIKQHKAAVEGKEKTGEPIFKPEHTSTLVLMALDAKLWLGPDGLAMVTLVLDALYLVSEHLTNPEIELLTLLWNYEWHDRDSDDKDMFENNLTLVLSRKSSVAKRALKPLSELFRDERVNKKRKRILSAINDCASTLFERPAWKKIDREYDPDELVEERDLMLKLVYSVLEHYRTESTDLLTEVAGLVMSFKLKEALPKLRHAFKAGLIDESYYGDWSDVVNACGLTLDPNDDLVRMCHHCNRPHFYCRRDLQEWYKKKSAEALQSANDHFTGERYKEAAKQYENALAYAGMTGAFSTPEEAHYKRAVSLRKIGLLREALEALSLRSSFSIFIKKPDEQHAALTAEIERELSAQPPRPPLPASQPPPQYAWQKAAVRKGKWDSHHKHHEDTGAICITNKYIGFNISCYDFALIGINNFNTKPRLLKGSAELIEACYIYGDQLVTGGGKDFAVRLFNIANNKLIRKFEGHTEGITSLHMDDKFIVSTALDRTLRIWDKNSTKEPRVIYLIKASWCAKFDSSDNTLIFTAGDSYMREYDLVTGEYRGGFFVTHQPKCKPPQKKASDIARNILYYCAFNQHYATASSSDLCVTIWSRPDRQQLWHLQLSTGSVIALDMSLHLVAYATRGASVVIVELATGRVVHTYRDHLEHPVAFGLYLREGEKKADLITAGLDCLLVHHQAQKIAPPPAPQLPAPSSDPTTPQEQTNGVAHHEPTPTPTDQVSTPGTTAPTPAPSSGENAPAASTAASTAAETAPTSKSSKGKSHERRCDYCGVSNVKLLKCSICLRTYYCSKDCQRGSWQTHKLICKKPSETETK